METKYAMVTGTDHGVGLPRVMHGRPHLADSVAEAFPAFKLFTGGS